MTIKNIEISGREIGHGQPCFVIAEAGVNHNGQLELAERLVDVAADAGCDAVKFQTFDSQALASANAPKADYQLKTTGKGESQLEMLRRLELPREAFAALNDRCRRRGVIFLSSPFEQASADLLDSIGVAAFKLPSGEVTNLPFLRHVAGKGRPIILSTGMSSMNEVAAAVEAIRSAGEVQFSLLHCVSSYPAEPADCNLRAMRTLEEAFAVPVGFSDHTKGTEVALAAVAIGACIVEKHFTLDRTMPGPDHAASVEPDALARMIRGIRDVEAALGDGRKVPVRAEESTAAAARKSLIAAVDIQPGAMLAANMIDIRRPGSGLPPSALDRVVGRKARRAIASGTIIQMEMLE